MNTMYTHMLEGRSKHKHLHVLAPQQDLFAAVVKELELPLFYFVSLFHEKNLVKLRGRCHISCLSVKGPHPSD